jgi:hypothetical protein
LRFLWERWVVSRLPLRKALACTSLICYKLMTKAQQPLLPTKADQSISFEDLGWHSQRAQFL